MARLARRYQIDFPAAKSVLYYVSKAHPAPSVAILRETMTKLELVGARAASTLFFCLSFVLVLENKAVDKLS
jgi:hypothetical protein